MFGSVKPDAPKKDDKPSGALFGGAPKPEPQIEEKKEQAAPQTEPVKADKA